MIDNCKYDKDENFYIENILCNHCANKDICKFVKRYTKIQKEIIKAIKTSVKDDIEKKLFYNAQLKCMYYFDVRYGGLDE